MRLLILVSLTFFLAGCEATEFVPIQPQIQAETLRPCPLGDQSARTVNQLAALALENRKVAECNISKLEAVGEVLAP